MKQVLDQTTLFIQEADWKDAALLTRSVFAFGLAIGLSLSPHHKKAAAAVSAGMGIASMVPLAYKFRKQGKK